MTEKIVEHIALKKKNFKGEETEVTIKDLLKYENLKSCNLFHFYITKEDINMFSMVIIGNSQTFVQDGFMVTPRGYHL